MEPRFYRPAERHRAKLYVTVLLVGILAFLGMLTMAIPIGLSEGGVSGMTLGIVISGSIAIVGTLIPLLLVGPYYNSLLYEIQDDEVIVRAGIITKSVKHVPYRTVTNLEVKRGPLDRIFNLGTLKIQTAGMSGQTGAEESLEGLPDVNEVYDLVARTLRMFRGSLSPTQTELETGEPASADGQAQLLETLIEEVRAIKQTLQDQ